MVCIPNLSDLPKISHENEILSQRERCVYVCGGGGGRWEWGGGGGVKRGSAEPSELPLNLPLQSY